MTFTAPDIDYAGLSPVIALSGGLVLVLMAGLFERGTPAGRGAVGAIAMAVLGTALGLTIWQWGESGTLVAGALRLDEFGLAISILAIAAGMVTVVLSHNGPAVGEARIGDHHALLVTSVLGMVMLAQAQNLVSLFISLELLSIPLYVLCGSLRRREESLESGLKYLIIGSLGSATLLYGLAFVYGATGATDFGAIAEAIESNGLERDALVLVGVALAAAGLAFKLSLAPFHQWTPDVYQGAPTPITGFMAVATKAAGFAALVRVLEVALGPVAADWQDALAALAVASIVVGNIGALGQDSLKRLLAYSGIAQAGYILTGVVVASELGLGALIFYLAAYAAMNLAAFAVIVARERETENGDDISAVAGIGRDRPFLAWPLTIAMLSLAGLPGTVGFIGKLFLIEAAIDGGYTWLAVAIVIGTMVSLVYYLRVVAAMWMRPEDAVEAKAPGELPAMAGAAPEADAALDAAGARWAGAELAAVAVLAAGVTIFFGIVPQPLAEWAAQAGSSLSAFGP